LSKSGNFKPAILGNYLPALTGMMDSPEYLEKAIPKILIYNENNYFLGKNLIITMETKNAGIKTQQLEMLIETYLT